MLKANLKLVYVENTVILSKIIFSSAKVTCTSSICLCAKFQIDSLKTLGEVDYAIFSFLKVQQMDRQTGAKHNAP